MAAEDRRFYEHGGFDVISTARAVLANLRTGTLSEGGSTLTQQLAKNLYFTQEKKFTRKAAELFMAWALEREYTKDEILELYINVIYYGDGCTGITAAAQHYFCLLYTSRHRLPACELRKAHTVRHRHCKGIHGKAQRHQKQRPDGHSFLLRKKGGLFTAPK